MSQIRVCSGCDVSDATREKFFMCSGCKIAHYCSIECQRKDWKGGHKHVCRRGKITRKDTTNLVQSLLRTKNFYKLVFTSRGTTDRVMFKMTPLRVKRLIKSPDLIDKDDLVAQNESEIPEKTMNYTVKHMMEPENYTYAVILYHSSGELIYHPFLVCKDVRQWDVLTAEISPGRSVSHLLDYIERTFPGSVSDEYRKAILALGDDVYNKTIHFLNEKIALTLEFSS